MKKNQTQKLDSLLSFLKNLNNDFLLYSHFSWRKIDQLI